MASSWRYPKRSKYRAKVSQDPEDFYQLDPGKSSAENSYDIFMALCCRDTRDTKRLVLLNCLATLCQQEQQQQQNQPTKVDVHSVKSNLGFTTEELLYCLSASLIHTFTQVRAAALRTIRFVLTTPKDVKLFNSLQLQHLLCRSIDVLLKNDDERVQALKLIRKMLAISAVDISPVLVRCLVSLANSGIEDGDNMLRACLATLCEFGVLNPTLLVVCGGVTAITRNVLECHNPRIAESLCGVLLYLLEWPQTRSIAGVRLDCLAAPYCDFTYRLGIMDKNKDARELRYTSCRLALLSVLRSWTGTIEFCNPNKPSGLKAIVDALYLNQLEVRRAILDLLYELLGLPQPAWTDDYSIALQTLDPSDFQNAWLLSYGFVAMEGRCILPSLAARAPNACEQHLSLLLYCFLETGLLNALVEVIVSNDTHLSVRATILIGKILHFMHTHLPADICSTSPALPTLISHATQGNQQATAAITALQNYQKMLRNRPASCSLFLDSIIQGGTLIQTRLFRRDINAQHQTHLSNMQQSSAAAGQPQGGLIGMSGSGLGTLERQRLDSVSSSDESNSQGSSSRRASFRLKRKLLPFFENQRVTKLIKDSNVLSVPDGMAWDWEVVIALLRSNLMRKMDDTTGKFLKRLVHYFKPSSSRFSHQDLAHGRAAPPFVIAGLDLIDWLLASPELESMRILTDFFSDISKQLLSVSTSRSVHDCLFSPQHMNDTMCQQYFLYIGRMCRVAKGISILVNTAVFEHLISLVCTTDHVCYVKLIVSGLDYSLESKTRKVLEKALTAGKMRAGRLYATQFLVVLLRARINNFEEWGIPLIIQQTRDPDRSVVLAAIDVLEEACHEKYYLEEIVSLWPDLKPLGDVGRLLMARYYSLSRGLNNLKATIHDEIEYWKNGYNKRYVLLVEADTHSSLTLHIRNEDGYYSRRNCNTRPIIIPPNIPAHLYGQMVQTAQGTTALRKFGDLPYLIDVVNRSKCSDDAECLELKAAIWAVGHASTHSNGIEYFVESGSRIYEKLVKLATKCDVYSIRATCFNVLGLIGGTNAGANILFKLNWLSVRHDRNTIWPVHQPEDWMSCNYTPVRHHYEDMPPYNYTGIEDQIDGSYYTGSYWNLLLSSSSTTGRDGGGASASSEAQEANTTAESSKTADDNALKPMLPPVVQHQQQQQVAAKSKTLPEGTYLRHGKHQRSLSESKTTDVISLISGTAVAMGAHHLSHRIRYNSCTDSNTSGVSSCESVTMRVPPMGSDFQQFPLSPIPSMSNLVVDVPQQSATLMRGTSLVGTSYMQNALSPADIKGYAQFRSLRNYCRPHFPESNTDVYDIIDRIELLSLGSSAMRLRKSSFGETQRRIKVRSLDRQSSLRIPRLDFEELQQVPLPTLTAPKFLSQNDSKGPCYSGICLPKNLYDLFPARSIERTYVSRDIQDTDLMDTNLLVANHQCLNDSLNNEGGDESSVISSLSDVSSVSKRSKWLGAKHGRNNCMSCSRARRSRTHTQRLDSDTAGSDVQPSTSGAQSYATAVLTRKLSKQQQQPQQSTQTSSSTIQLSDFSFNSPESILSEESMPDRLTANILYNVQRLANPVSAKQSKMALLELKQKHPLSFQDICLYSEVCKALGRSSYRMNARRFLQELFLDLNFDSFYIEPTEILAKKEKDFTPLEHSDIDSRELNARSLKYYNPGSGARDVVSGASVNYAKGTTAPLPLATNFLPSHKAAHPKSQPLASVYETSCENLLQDASLKLEKNSKSKAKASNSKCDKVVTSSKSSKCDSAVSPPSVAPPPAAPPPLGVNIRNELRITSESDDSEYDDCNRSPQWQFTTLRDEDEVDSIVLQRVFTPPASSTSMSYACYTTCTSTASSQPTISSSNCSDQTTNSSNRSSICTVSRRPLSMNATTPTSKSHKKNNGNASNVSTNMNTSTSSGSISTYSGATVENENKKYKRGRSYTLELDLSCTKNKFPITDRGRRITNWQTETTAAAVTSPAEQNLATLWPKPAVPSMQCTSNSNVLASGTASEITMKCAQSTTEFVAPTTTSPETAMTITKSLAASLAKPIGSLYCEKRLQALKSETHAET